MQEEKLKRLFELMPERLDLGQPILTVYLDTARGREAVVFKQWLYVNPDPRWGREPLFTRSVPLAELLHKVLQTEVGRSVVGLGGGKKEERVELLDSVGRGVVVTIKPLVEVESYRERDKMLYKWRIPFVFFMGRLLEVDEVREFVARMQTLMAEIKLVTSEEGEKLIEYLRPLERVEL